MDGGNIFPLVDRRAPLLSRMRNNEESSGELAEDVGEQIGEVILSSENTDTEKAKEEVMEAFRIGMAEEFGVPPDSIKEDAGKGLADLLDLKAEDVLTEEAQEQLGMEDGEEEKEEGDDDGSLESLTSD